MSGQKIIDGLNEAITFAKALAEATAAERERSAKIAEVVGKRLGEPAIGHAIARHIRLPEAS